MILFKREANLILRSLLKRKIRKKFLTIKCFYKKKSQTIIAIQSPQKSGILI